MLTSIFICNVTNFNKALGTPLSISVSYPEYRCCQCDCFTTVDTFYIAEKEKNKNWKKMFLSLKSIWIKLSFLNWPGREQIESWVNRKSPHHVTVGILIYTYSSMLCKCEEQNFQGCIWHMGVKLNNFLCEFPQSLLLWFAYPEHKSCHALYEENLLFLNSVILVIFANTYTGMWKRP